MMKPSSRTFILLATLLATAAQAQPAPLFDPEPTPATPAPTPSIRLGRALLDAGILPRLRAVNSFAANPIGGITQGTDASGVVIAGADFDLGRIAGLTGGFFHVSVAQLYGHELATDHIGTRTKVQSFYYPKKQFELSELTYEQSLLDGRLNIVVGRANATGEFARSTYGCRFQNVADCPFELTQAIGGFPGFPYVNWGGYARYNPTPSTYVKAGAFEINSARNLNTGFEWGFQKSTGFVIPVELGYGTAPAAPYQQHAKIGAWYNSADYTDPYLNTRFTSRGTFAGKPLAYEGGRAGLYALGDMTVWHAEEQSLALFASAGAPFDGRGLFAFQGVAGLLWTGPIPGRALDQIGLLGSYIRISNKENGYLNDLLRKARSPTLESRNQGIFELNYNLRLTEGAFLAAGLQYLVNPDSISRIAAPFAPRDALVVGFKLAINANEILGLPTGLGAR